MLIEREVVKRGHLEDIVLETLMKSNLYKVLDYSKQKTDGVHGRNFDLSGGRLSGVPPFQGRNGGHYYETLNGSEPISINRLSSPATAINERPP